MGKGNFVLGKKCHIYISSTVFIAWQLPSLITGCYEDPAGDKSFYSCTPVWHETKAASALLV